MKLFKLKHEKSNLQLQTYLTDYEIVFDEPLDGVPSSETKVNDSRRRFRSCSCNDQNKCMVIQSSFVKRGVFDRVECTQVNGYNSSLANSKFKLYCQALGI